MHLINVIHFKNGIIKKNCTSGCDVIELLSILEYFKTFSFNVQELTP
jgi:hypothetical protein